MGSRGPGLSAGEIAALQSLLEDRRRTYDDGGQGPWPPGDTLVGDVRRVVDELRGDRSYVKSRQIARRLGESSGRVGQAMRVLVENDEVGVYRETSSTGRVYEL